VAAGTAICWGRYRNLWRQVPQFVAAGSAICGGRYRNLWRQVLQFVAAGTEIRWYAAAQLIEAQR